MVPWIECPVFDLDLAQPVDQRYRGVPPDMIEKGRLLLQTVLAEIPGKAKLLADAVRLRTGNRFHAELRAVAQQIGADWRSVMIANLSYDLALQALGCSTAALPTPDGPVLARNMDWWPERVLAQTSYLIRACRDGRLIWANAGWPGTIGVVTGLSGRGFGLALNAVLSPEGVDLTGYPVLLYLRRVVEEAADFAEAVQMLTRQRLAAPCLLTVVGSQNDQRVVIERTPKRHALRRADKGQPLVATNEYRLMPTSPSNNMGQIDRTACDRHVALSNLLADHAGRPVEDDALLYALSDPAVIQEITAQHVIIRPRSQQIRLLVPRRLLETAPSSA